MTDGTRGDAAGTNGTPSGTGGWRPYLMPYLMPYLLIVLLTLAFCLVNILSAWDDRNWPLWLPVLTETSSSVVILALAWLPGLALARAPLGRPWWRVPLVHGPAFLAFTLLHTAGMGLLREGASALFDLGYDFPITGGVLVYEARKDFMTYLLLAGIFLLFGHGRPAAHLAEPGGAPDAAGIAGTAGPAPNPARAQETMPGPPLFDIRDGARLWRVAVADILAVRSAGNYAEFLLADGRRLLMRSTLTQLAGELSAHGLLRTHRSWLVNAAHVRAVAPDGSGDQTLTLSGGQSAPLSRRFPEALAALRGQG